MPLVWMSRSAMPAARTAAITLSICSAFARIAAIKQAQARAQTYADALGMRVRRVVSISEGGAGFPRPMPMMRAMAADAGMARETSVSPGESTLSVSLEVVFELGR